MLVISSWWSQLSSRRLRDITAETEHEQRRRIAEMEKDVTSFDDIQCMCNHNLRLSSFMGNQCHLEPKTHLLLKLDFRNFTRDNLSSPVCKYRLRCQPIFFKKGVRGGDRFLNSPGVGSSCMSPAVRVVNQVTDVDSIAQYESTLVKLSNAEVQIEDLKAQLDDALGAEDLLVQLTERNLMLGEKIEEMRITIEDLEALKELNDELEENHMETEKALQEDIGLSCCNVSLSRH